MKSIFNSLCILVFLAPCLRAQETDPVEQTDTASTAESGLPSDNRTEQDRIDLLLNVGSVYMEEQDYTSAISAFKRVLELDPENQQARYILTYAYINTAQVKEAVELLNQLIEDYPDDFQLKNNLAWLYATTPDPAFRDGRKAIKLAQQAMVLAPYDHHIWSTLSEAYYVSGDYEKAFRAIKQMAALASQSGNGITQEMVDNYNEQLRKCRRAWETEQALKDLVEGSSSSTNSPTMEL